LSDKAIFTSDNPEMNPEVIITEMEKELPTKL
jgi:hypothetical protein